MPHYQGQNYKVNRKVKEDVDKNQINYRESEESPLNLIKRIYITITDTSGNTIPEVTITIDETDIQTGYNGIIISNFPNEAETITVSKDGYKTATGTIVIDEEKQKHCFVLKTCDEDGDSEDIITGIKEQTEITMGNRG